MRKYIPIDRLEVGMFMEADVKGALVNDEIHHFLEPAGAATPGNKRARINERLRRVIADEGGFKVTSENHIQALRQTGLARLYIDTAKGSDLPEGVEELDPNAPTPAAQATIEAPALPADASADLLPQALAAAEPEAERPQYSKPRQRDNRRRDFGPGHKGWMKIEIVEDDREAHLRVLSFGGNPNLQADDLAQAFDRLYGIRAGLNLPLIERLARQAAAAPDRVIRGRFCIARAQAADPGEAGRIDYVFRNPISSSTTLPYKGLELAFGCPDLKQVLSRSFKARTVGPGELLARYIAPSAEAIGCDIYGNTTVRSGPELLLRPGDNVEVRDNQYLSTTYGYVCLLEGALSVIPALWVSPDRLEAHFVYMPPAGPRAELNWEALMRLLRAAKVRYGLEEDAIRGLIQEPPASERAEAVLIARGSAPEPGKDARIEFNFDPDAQAGAERPDGSIDLKERNQVISVKRNQLLATVYPSTEGKPGVDVCGNTLPGSVGRNDALKARKNVRSEWRGEHAPQQFFAAVDGHVRTRADSIWVHPVVYIEGDVDYDMGNVESGRDVHIQGSVRSGFSVRAGGSVSVGGTVESGASVHAQEDIVVSRGIVGASTRVVALGDLRVQFVQNSTVMARGDITVGSYLRNAKVRAGGRLTVQANGGERGGSVVGGQTFAAKGVRLRLAGSASTDRTVIGIGPDPEIAAQLAKLDKATDFCQKNILRIFRTLGTSDISAAEFKQRIQESSLAKRQAILRLLGQLKKITESRDQHRKWRRELVRQREATAVQAEITVGGTAFADVLIQIGEEKHRLLEDLKSPVFHLTPYGIRWRTAG